VLKQAGLVRDRRVGRETRYSAHPKALRPIVDWLGVYAAFWSQKLDKLEDLLDRMDQ
jgi:DNA-binding transcriptional ArsR family regulator